MCGIFGQISINQSLLRTNKFEFKKCLSYLNHRGPDDGGVYFDKKNIIWPQKIEHIRS